MKVIFSALALFISLTAFAQTQPELEHSTPAPPASSQLASSTTRSKDCARCDELVELDRKVLEELPKQEPNTAAYDVEAAKIVNSMGKLSSEQADEIVRYLQHTLPTDPSQGMIESIWPTISKNWDVLEKAAKKLSKDEIEVVWVPIQHYANSLKHGQDPVPSKKSKK